MLKSWKTSLLGSCAICLGTWLMHILYVPGNTLYFNICYVWVGPISLIISGCALILAKDHDK
jgi:hypothetical protein